MQPWTWLYVTALWEHLSRLDSIATLNFLFIGRSDDHIYTSFNTDKTHNQGEDAGYRRAFFHNVDVPETNFVGKCILIKFVLFICFIYLFRCRSGACLPHISV